MIDPTQPDDSTNEPTDDGPSDAYPDFVKVEDSDGISVSGRHHKGMASASCNTSLWVVKMQPLLDLALFPPLEPSHHAAFCHT
jgi:hypothetical protein